MAKLKEIEIKWSAEKVKREDFIVAMRKHLKRSKLKYTFLSVAGFDYYYSSKAGHVVRHRVSDNTNELTVKARLSHKSIMIRAEGNIYLTKVNDPTEVSGTLDLLGFSDRFSIYKDCDIYFIQDGKAEISIVWYRVKKPRCQNRIFLEAEVHGISPKKSQKTLNKWANHIQKMFDLSDKNINQKSLYEIYSGKTYLMA